MKLKTLLEGYAWEKKPGQSLPTLNDVQKAYNNRLSESPDSESIIQSLLEDAEEELEEIINKMSTDSNVNTHDKLIYLASLKKINYIIDRLQNEDLSKYYM